MREKLDTTSRLVDTPVDTRAPVRKRAANSLGSSWRRAFLRSADSALEAGGVPALKVLLGGMKACSPEAHREGLEASTRSLRSAQ